MKNKLVKLSILIAVMFSLTGCGKTYLSCSKTITDNDSLRIDEIIELGYKRTKLVNSNVYYNYLFKNNNESDIAAMKAELNKECELYKDMKGVNCQVGNISGGLYFELSLKVDEISEEDSSIFEEMLDYGSYTKSYKELEKEYTCK